MGFLKRRKPFKTRIQAILFLSLVLISSLSVALASNESSQRSGSGRGPLPVILQPSATSPVKEFNITTPNSVPEAIINGSNQIFWFTEFGAGKIGELTGLTRNVTAEYPIPQKGSSPATLAMDTQGRIWLTDQNPSYPSVWVFNTGTRQFHQYLTNATNSTPLFVLVDKTDHIWFTDTTANYVAELSYPQGNMTKYSLPQPSSGPAEMALQTGTSYIWISEGFAGRIARFDMITHSFQEFIPTVPLNYPVGIVADPKGNIWVSEHGGSSVAEFIPSNSTFREYPTSQIGSATAPATLTMDGLGRLWFAEHLANKIGRLDPATGNMDEFTIPVPGAYSLYNTLDQNGDFWFTEADANKIGMIPGNASSIVTISPVSLPIGTIDAGQTVSSQLSVTNNLMTQITVSLDVTSSFSTTGVTSRSQVSLSNYALTLSPNQTMRVTIMITPDFTLPSGIYAAGVVAKDGTSAAVVGIFFLQVRASFLYQLEMILPYILIAAAVTLLAFLLIKRRKPVRRVANARPIPAVSKPTALVLLLLLAVRGTVLSYAKCPGLPEAPQSGPDYFGIALDAGSITFFAIVAYLLVRDRMRK